jgi:CxxC motif-containing protein (DUF1111 family)
MQPAKIMDLHNMKLIFPAVLALTLISGNSLAAPASDQPGEKPGGQTTVYANGRNAFSFPAANLTDEERTRFAIGNSFFRRNWVEAPSSTKARDGLGPHFIARSCGGCHVQDGRGAPPDVTKGEQPVGLLLRLSVPGTGDHGGVVPEPVYGDQFDNFAIQQVHPEGKAIVSYDDIKGRFDDGTPYTLLQPSYGFSDLGYGPMAKDVMVSPRIAPQLIGVGLLEAIPEAEILTNAKQQKALAGSIKGMPNQVWDAPSQKMMLGRYGWKANVATIAHQTAGAFNGDIGITSSVFPNEACTSTQKDCLNAPKGHHDGATDIDDKTFGDVVFYQATLAPPARRGAGDKVVLRGQKLFEQAQCAVCHRPNYVTTGSPNPGLSSQALNGQTIWPYTDLLLHDMGDGLADGRPDFAANGKQWKTPPLWGVGLINDVNSHHRLLHDGRARGVMEAILWHGGEATESRQHVLKMNPSEREALVKFVESL